MIRLVTLLGILTILNFHVRAEHWRTEADSLNNLLIREKTDTGKIELNLELNYVLLSSFPEKAFEHAVNARKLAEKINDTALIIQSILRECDFYTQMGEYAVSLENAYNALNLAGKNKTLLSLCHNRIANIHIYLYNFNEGLSHHQKSMNLDRELGDTQNIAIDYCNLGTCFSELKMYDSALFYLHRANRCVIFRTGRSDPYSLGHIGNTYAKMQNYDSALYYHLMAYDLDSADERQYEMVMDENYIANTYYERKNFQRAKDFAFRSLDRAKRINIYDAPIKSYEILYKIYKNEGNTAKALEYVLLRGALKDTLRVKSNESLILGLETQYRVKEQNSILKAKEAEMALLENQKTLLIVLSLVSLLFLLSMVVTTIIIYRRQNANRALMHQLKLANDSKERLISIISHDLRGSVGTMRNAAKAISEELTDIEQTRELLESFYPVADSTYDLLENLLTWSKANKDKLVPLFDSIDMKDIIDKSINHVSHLATSKKININNFVESTGLQADKNMILSVVRNLLSNAIKFSHSRSDINIYSQMSDGKIIVSISDNGIGMDPELLSSIFESPLDNHTSGTMGERGSGLGLSICRTFVQKHGGRIWAESKEGTGSTFCFSLPLRKLS